MLDHVNPVLLKELRQMVRSRSLVVSLLCFLGALMAVAALAKNIRDCFNERAMMALIEGINGENEVVAEQCMAMLKHSQKTV